MNIDDIFNRRRKSWNKLIKARKNIPSDVECPKCKALMEVAWLDNNNWICSCGNYLMVTPKKRIEMICDEDSFKELYGGIVTKNPIDFPDYKKKIDVTVKKTKSSEAVITGIGKIDGEKIALAVMDGRFLMGSMGTAVGEKITRLIEYAGKKKLPLIIFCASGGARMQEGLFSLMQMAKTSAAIEKFKDNGGLYIAYQTNPTTGGVSASFANLGDIIIAEPGALICFAGPRVIEQTIGEKLPEGFQKSEFLLEHGMIDMIVERKEAKEVLSKIVKVHKG